MISFKPISEENFNEALSHLEKGLCAKTRENLLEIAEGLLFDADGVEYALCVFSDCLLMRIFDMGRYYFAFPYEIGENARVDAALDAIREYTLREELPYVLVDVPCECLAHLKGYRHMDVDAEDEAGESYRVKIKTECELLDEIPTVVYNRVKLNAITEADTEAYARLSRDENVNKYWGYDYKDDVESPTDAYFFENAVREFNSGVGICMAVRAEDELIGEAELYAFDGKGGAEFAIRLFSLWHGMGYGTEGVYAIMEAARKIGLINLHTSVMRDNTDSLRMLEKIADKRVDDGERISFTIYLY